jgi:predicted phosphoribosyltransferase
MLLRDRGEAAERLAAALAGWGRRDPLVLGIPRGAVPMARTIADRLGGEADVVLVRKLRAPGNPEYAIGSVDESGWVYLTPYAAAAGATPSYIETEKAHQLATIRQRRSAYTAHRPARDPAGRIVIVVDDGLATGSTMIAALHALRARKPSRLICAVPVAPPETIERVRPYADEVVCLHTPRDFDAVGQFYRDFPQVEDDEVIKALAPT